MFPTVMSLTSAEHLSDGLEDMTTFNVWTKREVFSFEFLATVDEK
jgi:hypothetical protein